MLFVKTETNTDPKDQLFCYLQVIHFTSANCASPSMWPYITTRDRDFKKLKLGVSELAFTLVIAFLRK